MAQGRFAYHMASKLWSESSKLDIFMRWTWEHWTIFGRSQSLAKWYANVSVFYPAHPFRQFIFQPCIKIKLWYILMNPSNKSLNRIQCCRGDFFFILFRFLFTASFNIHHIFMTAWLTVLVKENENNAKTLWRVKDDFLESSSPSTYFNEKLP